MAANSPTTNLSLRVTHVSGRLDHRLVVGEVAPADHGGRVAELGCLLVVRLLGFAVDGGWGES